jgi:prepilin-type N-terminal cleavage/methylation domain-containing protein
MKNKKGFTLIESLVAITVLMLVISGASTAVSQGISSYTYSKNQITAFYLAQEGIEHVRNMRDQNGLTGVHWLRGFAETPSDPCFFGRVCQVGLSSVDSGINYAVSACSGTCPNLRHNASSGFYGYDSSWVPSIFRREVRITSVSSNEVQVAVTVSWSFKSATERSFTARENILNWQ